MTDANKDTPEGTKKGEVDPVIEKTDPVLEKDSITPAAPEPAAQEPKEEATESVEIASTETKPVEDECIETAPVESEAVDTEEVKLTGDVLIGTQQAESKPTEDVSEEAPPVEITTTETKAVEVKPVESKITEPAPVEPTPVEPAKGEPTLVESKPEEEETPASRPSDTEPTKVDPIETKSIEEVEDFSDPDEDDLDDLDDMLDDFSTVKLDSQKAPTTSSAPRSDVPNTAPSNKQPEVDETFSEEEFAKQLQAGMADLLGELEKSPDMQAQFEDIFKQIAASEGTTDPAAPSSSAKPPPPQATAEDASFQDTIRRTMERMQASGDQATAAAASGGADDFMSEMLKQLSSGDLGALGGEENEEEFSKMLMGMMEQLTNREILYEPMKELDEKFPEWLAKNRSTTPQDDLKRYEEQQAVVREIVAKFEEKTYSDSNAADREFIVDKMQKMQAAGSPPSDLVGDMPSAQEALNPGDEACNPQ